MPPLKAPLFDDPQVTATEMKVGNVSQPEDRHVARAVRDLPFLMTGDTIEVLNVDRRAWTFQWEQRKWKIEPGEKGFIPFEAVVDIMGDPRSKDNVTVKYNDGQGNRGMVMDRYTELCRGFARYAVENESLEELRIKAPKLECKTLMGLTVTFPYQAPDMLAWPTPMLDPHSVDSDTVRMVDKVAAENADLREKYDDLIEKLDKLTREREGVQATE